jgi:hypothetical protein
VGTSWSNFWGACKSRLSTIGRECFLGRAEWRSKARKLRTVIRSLRSRVARLRLANKQLKQTVEDLRTQLAQRQQSEYQSRMAQAPESEKPPGCQYTAADIELAVNLARAIGLRPARKAMMTVFSWLKYKRQVPSYQAIRNWMQRIGLDRIKRPRKTDNATWLVDHTCQTGKEKVLTILRVRSSQATQDDHPLKQSDLEPLAVVSRSRWTHADVQAVYKATCEKYGAPRAILADQASDLQAPALALKKAYPKVIPLVDFKHFLANQFKQLLTGDPDYAAFTKHLKYSCACVQQTSLSHFVPRPLKRKARFMNMGPILEWAGAVLWHLDHPESQACADVSPEQMKTKFGWLHSLEGQITQWKQCQDVIDAGVYLAATKGLSRATPDAFRKLVEPLANCEMARTIVQRSIEFLEHQAAPLRADETLPLSTEAIESVFARYKALENQHSKEGFSGLLLALGTLLRPVTEKEVLSSFQSVKCKDVKEWIKACLGRTYTFKRQKVFREYATATKLSREIATAIAA